MFYERLKALRIANCLSQVQLAHKLGVSKQSVSNWESAYIQPPIDTVIKICRIFHVSADYLLGLDDRKMLDVTGLESEQVAHLQALVNDLLGE